MGLIAIGDIHGCARSLDALIEKLQPSAADHLVFVGDYVDRGPDSCGVIERLLELSTQVECSFLRGNHESLMLEYLSGKDTGLWWVNGGTATMESYSRHGIPPKIPDSHKRFLNETLLYLDTPDFFFVHAGLKPNLSIKKNIARISEETMLWERSHLQARSVKWEKPVVFGHTPQPKPIDRDRMIGIDTGCVYYGYEGFGRLTAVRLPERTYVQVPYTG